MKQFLSKEARETTISHIIVLAAGIGMFAVVYYFGVIAGFVGSLLDILSPFLLGFGISFLMLPIMRRLERGMLRTVAGRKPRLCRVLSAIVSIVIFVLIITGFLLILLPQLISSIKSLVKYIADYVTLHSADISELLMRNEFVGDLIKVDGQGLQIAWEGVASKLMSYTNLLFDNIVAISSSVYSLLYHVFVGLIVAFYIMLEKDMFCRQMKKSCYALLQKNVCETIISWTRRANSIFSGFIRGKILDSLIIGLICYACMLIFRIEYALFISVIVGITNVIPFFGPFIGAVPCILILLIINPISALWFAVFILLLQQVDGNIIGPKILGDYVGISPLWIMLAIIVGSALFGFAGMLLSVPMFALLYAIGKSILEDRLAKKNLPLESEQFSDAPEIFMDENSRPVEPRERPAVRRLRKKEKVKA